MKQYISPLWQPILAFNGLDNFDALWNLQAEWFETPNQRRGGWSGVCRVELLHPRGGTVVLYLKRQQNHRHYCWRHPIKGSATFQREARNIVNFKKLGIPSLNLIYFGEQEIKGDNQAILITEALTDYAALDHWLNHWQGSPLTTMMKEKITFQLAKVIRAMHDAGYRHGSLYPKHIYLKVNDEQEPEVRLIDLEKARYSPFKKERVLKDLGTLKKHAVCTDRDRVRFLKHYFHDAPQAKQVIKKVAQVIVTRRARKQRQKQQRQAT